MSVSHACELHEEEINFHCDNCGEKESACTVCGKQQHRCLYERQLVPKGFRQIETYPEYRVNRRGAVVHIATGRFCKLARLDKNGNALIVIVRRGEKKIMSAQHLRHLAFPDDFPPVYDKENYEYSQSASGDFGIERLDD